MTVTCGSRECRSGRWRAPRGDYPHPTDRWRSTVQMLAPQVRLLELHPRTARTSTRSARRRPVPFPAECRGLPITRHANDGLGLLDRHRPERRNVQFHPVRVRARTRTLPAQLASSRSGNGTVPRTRSAARCTLPLLRKVLPRPPLHLQFQLGHWPSHPLWVANEDPRGLLL